MKHLLLMLLAGLLAVPTARGQAETPVERIVVPFSNPDRPGTLRVSAPNAQITVVGYDGDEAIIEARGRLDQDEDDRDDRPSRAGGLRRLAQPGLGLEVEEANNEMSVELHWGSNREDSDLHIRVPRTTALDLSTLNGGDIVVEGVRGDHEINNLNGEVTLRDIAGSVVVSALNGDIEVTFTQIHANMPMSFSSMNGDIDVTFPPGLRADLIMKTEQGEVYTDFEVTMDERPRVQVDDDRDDGVYRVEVNSALYGTVGGGGPEIRFKTFNGDIYIRRGE